MTTAPLSEGLALAVKLLLVVAQNRQERMPAKDVKFIKLGPGSARHQTGDGGRSSLPNCQAMFRKRWVQFATNGKTSCRLPTAGNAEYLSATIRFLPGQKRLWPCHNLNRETPDVYAYICYCAQSGAAAPI